ncbi:polysaccharide biosynthesis C-terminal domain-containing protein [Streptomyces sp. S.PB5]|uniref:lipopolysaccharide biosynthesis protein n=1 Tax=Streptomyces sp. S.PB5 TaxID=3020844 RepID=UPI0025B21F10|nr:polysaccharide biosynthesis C-terminal domain-containing protein [Streptomyces sp. S.PB5]MDN3025496.1 polysaccharide biosynthesis C-terminal domain-containing protein [Streptomyces sp. S.PB5]
MKAAAEQRSPELGPRTMAGNLAAQGCAVFLVFLSGLLVARLSGPEVLGGYALLRVLPWLTGVVVSCGLPLASAYYLAGELRDDPRLRPTLALLAAVGSTAGALVWLAMVPLLDGFFPDVPRWQLTLVAVTVLTQLLTVWGKACCQGRADMPGADLVIVAEEFLFLPAYGLALLTGLRDTDAVVAGLLGGGVAATATSLGRLVRTGFGHRWGRPSAPLAAEVLRYGARGQLGNLLLLVNLRLDFLAVGALSGPAVLGVYAVASKFAELVRLPAVAVHYVLYPRFARDGPLLAGQEMRRMLPRALAVTAAPVPLLLGAAALVLPLLYGPAFSAAVLPACILLGGLAFEGATAVCTAYLYGVGRPGLTSCAMGAGVAVTVVLDVLLIPRFGAVGAAVASSASYLVTAVVAVTLTWAVTRSRRNHHAYGIRSSRLRAPARPRRPHRRRARGPGGAERPAPLTAGPPHDGDHPT